MAEAIAEAETEGMLDEMVDATGQEAHEPGREIE